ncbi:hypothetical protein ABZ615_04975 [Streptomyces sp. NPDC007325]|uniref:hypothetical protein n=1 Tax=Streptomyces sp. NPDC007325 TaxID=3154588 RepID=UPI003407B96E
MSKEQEILDKISELKDALIKARPDPDSKDKKATLPSLLKDHLINAAPKIATEELLSGFLKDWTDAYDKIKQIHVEVTKHKTTEMLEMLGLNSIAAVHEKYQEAQEDPTVAWKDWLWGAIGGAVLLVAIPALALFFTGQLVNLSRTIQTWRPFGDNSPEARAGRRILAGNGNGGLAPQTLSAVNQREARVWNGGTSIADLVGDPANAQNAETLARALEKLNPQVERFEAKAPSFLNSFKRLPNQSKADKAATVLETMGEAIKKINATKLKKIADGLEKLNKELDTFQPTKLPTDTQLGNTAQAMSNLATQTGTLRDKFRELRGSISSLDQVIAGSGAGSN